MTTPPKARLNKLQKITLPLTLITGTLFFATPTFANSSSRFIEKDEMRILKRLQPALRSANVPYPPSAVRLAVFKEERRAELWLPDLTGKWQYVKTWRFSASSGKQGPKLYYGDLQIPEGIYSIDALLPSPQYHLALHLQYPNEFDLAMLTLDGRDPEFMSRGIYVHGGAISYGCVVIGDANIEEFFLLAHKAGQENTQVFIFPHDTDRAAPRFRICADCPIWYGELLRLLATAMGEFRKP